MAMTTTRLQYLLSQSAVFLGRVEVALCRVAAEVEVETGVGATHAARVHYAIYALANPSGAAAIAAVFLSQSTNVANTITMEDEGVRTSVTDGALFSQVSSDWNRLAGIDSGS